MDWKQFLKPTIGKIIFSAIATFVFVMIKKFYAKSFLCEMCMPSLGAPICPKYNSWMIIKQCSCDCYTFGQVAGQWIIYVIIPFIIAYALYSIVQLEITKK